jgi:hypothetical protein
VAWETHLLTDDCLAQICEFRPLGFVPQLFDP